MNILLLTNFFKNPKKHDWSNTGYCTTKRLQLIDFGIIWTACEVFLIHWPKQKVDMWRFQLKDHLKKAFSANLSDPKMQWVMYRVSNSQNTKTVPSLCPNKAVY